MINTTELYKQSIIHTCVLFIATSIAIRVTHKRTQTYNKITGDNSARFISADNFPQQISEINTRARTCAMSLMVIN